MSGQVSFCGEGMERVKGAVLEGPALVIAEKEMRSDDEIASYVNVHRVAEAEGEGVSSLCVPVSCFILHGSSSIHIGVRVFRPT